MKIVFDTNVILSAYVARGLANTVFEHCLEEHEIVISAPILAELESRLQEKLKIPKHNVAIMSDLLRIACQVDAVSEVDPSACRDRTDLHILGLALHSKADVIVSGDEDLLIIRSFNGIPIQTPRQFWESERKKDPRLLGMKTPGTSHKVHDRSPRKYQSGRRNPADKSKR